MAFDITRKTTLSATEAWARLTNWERHSGLIPFTVVRLAPGPGVGLGSGLVARTTLGPLRFEDPMEVTFWRPPTDTAAGVCRIVKRGRVVVGWAVLTVTPTASGAVVNWHESAHFGFAGEFLKWPTGVAGRLVFSRLVEGLLHDASHGGESRPLRT